MRYKVLGLTGFSRVGKDSLCKALIEAGPDYGFNFKRIALADSLKEDCNEECLRRFSISAFSEKTEEKKIIRPFLVESSKKNRKESNGSHYFFKILKQIEENNKNGIITIISDVRHAEFERDENVLLKEFGGKLVSIIRDDALPANKEEEENYPKLLSLSDFKVKIIKNENPKEYFRTKAHNLIQELIDANYL